MTALKINQPLSPGVKSQRLKTLTLQHPVKGIVCKMLDYVNTELAFNYYHHMVPKRIELLKKTSNTSRKALAEQRSLFIGFGESILPICDAMLGMKTTAIDIREDFIENLSRIYEQFFRKEVEGVGGSLEALKLAAEDISNNNNFKPSSFDNIEMTNLFNDPFSFFNKYKGNQEGAITAMFKKDSIIRNILKIISAKGTILISHTPPLEPMLKYEEILFGIAGKALKSNLPNYDEIKPLLKNNKRLFIEYIELAFERGWIKATLRDTKSEDIVGTDSAEDMLLFEAKRQGIILKKIAEDLDTSPTRPLKQNGIMYLVAKK